MLPATTLLSSINVFTPVNSCRLGELYQDDQETDGYSVQCNKWNGSKLNLWFSTINALFSASRFSLSKIHWIDVACLQAAKGKNFRRPKKKLSRSRGREALWEGNSRGRSFQIVGPAMESYMVALLNRSAWTICREGPVLFHRALCESLLLRSHP